MKKRLLAMLLVLMLVVSLLPTGALAANSQGTGEALVTLDYENGNDADKHIEVYVYVGNEIKQTIDVFDAGTTYTKVSVNVNDGVNYEINYVEASGGVITNEKTDSKSYSCRWTTSGETRVLNVYLVDPSHPHPETPSGEYDGSNLAYFYLDIVQAYKLLMLHFYEERGYGTSHGLICDADANVDYTDIWGSISNVAGAADPENISGLTIKYDDKDVLITPDQFLLDFDGNDRYDIKSTDDTKHAVLFFENTSVSGSSGYFTLYDLYMVNDGGYVDPLPEGPEHVGYEFGNWATEKSGGMQFTKNTVVTDDMKIYEQMLSGAGVTAGTQIHVQNENNELLARYVELFNAKYDANITLENLLYEDVYNSVKIRVNGYSGTQTNHNYNSGVQANGWRDHYYLVYNRDVAGDSSASNDHIEYNDIKSITVFINVYGDDNIYAIDIMKGDNPGQFETTVGSVGVTGGDDAVWNFEMVSAPEKPGTEDIEDENGELAGVVIVDCTTNDEHADKTTAPIAGTYNIGNVVATADGGYTCDITISPADGYATFYGDSHSMVSGQEAKTVTLTYDFDSKSWTNPASATVTFTVECETTEPGPVARLDVDKTVAIPDGKGTAAVGDVLEYTVTISSLNGVASEDVIVTDTMWESDSSVKIGGKGGQLQPVTADEDGCYVTVDVPVNGSVVIYYTYTVPETDAGKTVGNTVTVGEMSVTTYTTVDEAGEPEEPGKPQTVQVVIYRNGDITKPYATIDVPGYKTGDTIYTEDFNINDYYTKDKFATDFVFDGWFDDGRWNNYKDAGCPEEDFTTVDEIYVNGWKNVIAMVWDVYPVNYHVLDEDGNEIDNKTDYITERDLAGYELWDYSKAGHTFDGWYENDKDIGNDSKKEPVPLAPLKKYELYGLCDPIPQHLEIYAAIDKNKEEAVKIYSDMVDYGTPLVAYLETLELETDIFPGYSPEDGKWYKYDSPKWTFGENDTVSGWTKVLINYVPNEYTIYYHGNGGLYNGEHDQVSSRFKYDSTATIKNNVFEKAGYVFEGWALSADGEVVYTGSEKVPFTEENFPGLLENGKFDLYAVWAVDKIGTEDPSEGDGVPDKYQATVNFVAGKNGKVTGEVTKVYTIFGADGQYAKEGVITPSLEDVTVTPDEGYKVDGWTNAANERVNPESEITVKGGEVVVFTVNFQSDPSLKEITSFEKKLVTDRRTYHSFGLRVPTFIRNGSTVVVDEGKGVTLLYAISLTGTPGAEYAITDTGADVADGSALTGVIPETGVVTVYVTKDFTWREAAAAAYKDDALVNTAAVELTDNPNEPGQESTEEVDVVIDWDDPNVPVVPSDPDDDDDEDEDDEVFVPNWLNTEDHYAYIVGYEDGTIKPNNNITRAEVATIFFRLLTDNARARYWSQTNDYSDVAADSWYNNAVSTLSNMGIINGYEDGTFKPNASITRAEFTAIATRFFDYEAEYDGAFNDVSARAWYADYVQAAVDMGLVDGYPDGGFHPNSNITRAEAVTIVNRVLNRAPHEDHLLDEDEMNVWPDNVYGAWYYADMQEATNSHDYDWIRVSGERVEEWTEKLPERDWAALEQEWSSSHDA